MINLEEIKLKIKELAPKYNLSFLVLFGSQAKGKTHPKSDVDFAFLPENQMGLIDIAKMAFDFSENLKIKNLEMTSLKNVSSLLLKQVARNSIILYEKETGLFAKFKIYAIKRYMEEKKLLDLREMSLQKFLQKI